MFFLNHFKIGEEVNFILDGNLDNAGLGRVISLADDNVEVVFLIDCCGRKTGEKLLLFKEDFCQECWGKKETETTFHFGPCDNCS